MLHLQKQRICSVPSININKSIECCSKTYIFLFKLTIQLLKAFYSDRLIHCKAFCVAESCLHHLVSFHFGFMPN